MKSIDARKFSANYSASKYCDPAHRFADKKTINHFNLHNNSNEFEQEFK